MFLVPTLWAAYEGYNSEKTVKVNHEHKPTSLGFFEHLQIDLILLSLIWL